jgi:C4-dicarboxylate transporter DctM subunit
MDPFLIALLGLLAMFVLIALHVPIGIAMMAVGVLGYAIIEDFGPALSTMVNAISGNIENPGLAVIPLFLLMGSFATAGGLSAEIYRFANAFVGHRRGGLAMATMGGCGVFGAVCGSSTATAATFGRVALPEMLKRGYAPNFAAGTIAAGGTLGALVPPSIIMIIYSVITFKNVLDMFVAAVIPAILAILFHFAAIWIYLRLKPDAGPAGERSSWRERWAATRGAWAVLLMLLAVIGGIYGGVVTVDEAAALPPAPDLAVVLERAGRERGSDGDDLRHHFRCLGLHLFHHGRQCPAGPDRVGRFARYPAACGDFRAADHVHHPGCGLRHDLRHVDYPAFRAADCGALGLRPHLVGHHQRCRG